MLSLKSVRALSGIDVGGPSEPQSSTPGSENTAAAAYAAGNMRASCKALSNEPGEASTVECEAGNDPIYIALTHGGPWDVITFADDQPVESSVKSGTVKRSHEKNWKLLSPTSAQAAMLAKFTATSMTTELHLNGTTS